MVAFLEHDLYDVRLHFLFPPLLTSPNWLIQNTGKKKFQSPNGPKEAQKIILSLVFPTKRSKDKDQKEKYILKLVGWKKKARPSRRLNPSLTSHSSSTCNCLRALLYTIPIHNNSVHWHCTVTVQKNIAAITMQTMHNNNTPEQCTRITLHNKISHSSSNCSCNTNALSIALCVGLKTISVCCAQLEMHRSVISNI